MATRSSIGYETDNGGCVAVYCHFDGYPSHMLPVLKQMSFEEVKAMVEDALHNGGLRNVNEDLTYQTYGHKLTYGEESGYNDWKHNTAFAHINETDYAYYKRKDGTVFATDFNGRELE
jgi:hypothetical protein